MYEAGLIDLSFACKVIRNYPDVIGRWTHTGRPASSRIAGYATAGANTATSMIWSWPRNSIFISPVNGSHRRAVYMVSVDLPQGWDETNLIVRATDQELAVY